MSIIILFSFILAGAGCSSQAAAPINPAHTSFQTQEPSLPSQTEVKPTTAPAIPTPDLFEVLVAKLHSSDPDQRKQAAEAMGAMKDPRTIQPLIAALNEDYPYVSEAVKVALAGMGEPAVEPLIAALQDENLSIKAGASDILGMMQDPRAIQPLIDCLTDFHMGFSASYALSLFGATAVEPLTAAMQGDDYNVRMSSLTALGMIQDEDAVRAVFAALKDETLYNAAKDILLNLSGTYAIQPAMEALGDDNDQVVGWAYSVLRQIGTPTLEPLNAAMTDENWKVRQGAANLLGELRDLSSVEPLLSAVNDENADVRKSVLYALILIDDPRVTEPFTSALQNNDFDFIAEHYGLFIRLGLEGSEAALIQVLNERGSKEMAEDFLNCGNTLLVEAATQWAESHGYTITQVPGSGGASWGFNSP